MNTLLGALLLLLILCSYSCDSCWGFIHRYSVATSTTCWIARDQYRRHRSLTRCWGKINGNITTATSSSSSSTTWLSPPTPTIRMSDIDSADDSTNSVQGSSSQAMAHLLETVVRIQSEHVDAIRILPHSELRTMTSPNNNNNIRDINSIVFTVERRPTKYNNFGETTTSMSTDYVLAILDSMDRVNVTRLEEAVVAATISIDGDEGRNLLSLAPNEKLAQICGFVKGTVPPLGLQPAPLLTVVEASLLSITENNHKNNNDNSFPLLVGGGGQPGQSTLLPIQTLLDIIPKVHVAHFRSEPSSSSSSSLDEPVKAKRGTARTIKSTRSWGRSLVGHENERFQKPFFAIAPPDTEVARQIVAIENTINDVPSSQESSMPFFQPEWVAVVGRISGVRQMARRLVFVDLAPPIVAGALDNEDDDIHPWRSPSTGQDMAVQLIVGKTYCQRIGVMEEAELAMRRLKFGQLVMVQGKTNVGTRDSLKNWITKTSLDIVVFDIQQLQLEGSAAVPEDEEEDNRQAIKSASTLSASKKYRQQMSSTSTATTLNPNLAVLQLQDMYPDATLEKAVRIIDDLQGVQHVQSKLDTWLEAHPNQVGLVGMDCEWKPNFLAGGESQPVLLLQLCIHPLQEVYLLDLQTLIRPLCRPTEPMTDVEAAFAQLMHRLYETPTLVKVGFQVTNDLQRLAASYRHIAPLRSNITSVLEVSRLGMKVLQLTRQPNSRTVTASLAKMVEHFAERNLNKNEQVSDWSQRPLSPEQQEYAALDAVVTPYIVERLLEAIGARFVAPSSLPSSLSTSSSLSSTTMLPRMERWENDATFVPYFHCFRFLLLNETETLAIRRWKAKRVVGDASSYLVSQSWISGQAVPNLPFIPEDGSLEGAYSDVQGVVRVPCHGVTLADDTKDHMLDSMLGCWSANTKDGCLVELLDLEGDTNNNFLGNSVKGANLDFNRRSGFVELANAVVLFVNLPASGDGRGHSRSYPNEWLDNGSILSWFVKENDWQGGTTKLAQKMTLGNNTVVLFVRRGKGPFFCCGRCKVVTTLENTNAQHGGDSDQWSIVKLFLLLTDFDKLQSVPAFQKLV